jgi:hypothetical protein
MLDRQKGDIVFECNACGDVLETNQADFDVARVIFRREGWRIIRYIGKEGPTFARSANDVEI